nr:hypothetical protein [Rhodococcus sp. (in: high G+C Gram-positive bacteria)]
MTTIPVAARTDSDISLDSEVSGSAAADMVSFLRRWYQYGGGSDSDIFVTFGVSARHYFRSVHALLQSGSDETISERERNSMMRVCRARVWLTDPQSPSHPSR